MKKALLSISLIIAGAMVSSAQVIQVGGSGTVNGTPVGVGVTVGGTSGGQFGGTIGTQGQVNGSGLLSLLALAQNIVARLVPFAIGIAVLAFFWYLILFIWKGSEDGDEKKKSLAGMGYSILALFVMVAVWGIIGFMSSLLGIQTGGSVPVPGIPVPTN